MTRHVWKFLLNFARDFEERSDVITEYGTDICINSGINILIYVPLEIIFGVDNVTRFM